MAIVSSCELAVADGLYIIMFDHRIKAVSRFGVLDASYRLTYDIHVGID